MNIYNMKDKGHLALDYAKDVVSMLKRDEEKKRVVKLCISGACILADCFVIASIYKREKELKELRERNLELEAKVAKLTEGSFTMEEKIADMFENDEVGSITLSIR